MNPLEAFGKLPPKTQIQLVAAFLLVLGATSACAPAVELPTALPVQAATATFTPVLTETPIPTPMETMDPATFPKCDNVNNSPDGTVSGLVAKMYAPKTPPLKINGKPVYISVEGAENIPLGQIYNPDYHGLDRASGKKICVGLDPQAMWEDFPMPRHTPIPTPQSFLLPPQGRIFANVGRGFSPSKGSMPVGRHA